MVGRHLKAGQHQHRVLHLLNAEACDAQDLPLVCHLICQESHMPIVDLDAVIVNCHLDLLDYLSTGGFDS